MSFTDGKFGRLTIRKEIAPDIYLCDCACGNELHVWRSLLANDVQKDCGMCRRDLRGKNSLHGHVRFFNTRDGRKNAKTTREYNTWTNMTARCVRKTCAAYPDYGGRGIRCCERWLPHGRGQGFRNFLDDLGPRPLGYTLDRKDPQAHYEPTNCQWADKDTQTHNKRSVLYPDGDVPVLDESGIMEELGLPF